MGTYSWYLTSRNNAATCEINWDSNIFDHGVLRDAYGSLKTLEEVGKAFHERKLFGYLTDSVWEDLRYLSASLVPNGCFPRLYYSWEGNDDVFCIEFVPGSPIVNIYVLEDVKDANESVPEHSGWQVY
jgi:hypothetical protein